MIVAWELRINLPLSILISDCFCAKNDWINRNSSVEKLNDGDLVSCATFQLRCGLFGTRSTDTDSSVAAENGLRIAVSTEGFPKMSSSFKTLPDP